MILEKVWKVTCQDGTSRELEAMRPQVPKSHLEPKGKNWPLSG